MNDSSGVQPSTSPPDLACERPGADARYFSNILDAIADPVFVKDERLRFVTLNDAFCKFMGRERSALEGRSDPDFFPAEQVEVFRKMDEEVFLTGRESVNEELLTDALGITHEISTKKSLYVAEDGQKFIVGVIRDLTSRKQQEREIANHLAERERLSNEQIARLQQLDRMKDQFVSMLSHELRTPIHTILGTATILEDELAGPLNGEQRQFLERMIRSTEGLLTLVNDLLDLSLIQSGQFVISPRPIGLGEVVAGVIANLTPLAEEKGLRVIEDVPEELPDVVADEQRVGQVLANLLSNAIKFTPEGGEIIVEARRVGASLLCEVRDTGHGIEEADLHRLFQRFGQLNPGNTRVTRGTGLGLVISKSLVEAHQGEIGVTSTPGVGSTFWFTLPL